MIILDNNLNEVVSYYDFFSAFGYSDQDKLFLRTFNDKGRDAPGKNFDFKLKDFTYFEKILHDENKADRGVFFIVNGGGHTDKAVKTARAQFVDFDDFPFEEQIKRIKAFPLEPSIIIKTRKSLHCYWLLDGGEIKYFREVQERLIQYFGSDPVIKNESRVMRLYGFEHRKTDTAVMVTLIKFNPELRYNQRQFHEVLPLLDPANRSTEKRNKETVESITVGQGHKYMISKIGEIVGKLGDTVSDEAILALVNEDFFSKYEGEINRSREEHDKAYLSTIRKAKERREAEKQDPGFYSFALKAWKRENPGKEFDTDTVSWEEVREAGRRAKEDDKRIEAENHKRTVKAALAAVGMSDTEYSESMTVTYNFDGSIYQIIDKADGKIIFDGVKANPANPAAAAPANIEPATDPAAPWEPIKKGKDLPAFPLERFPGWIKDYIDSFADSTGISKDFCAACVLGAVSTVICGHLQIHFNGTHYEPAQLYTVFVGRSGSMKSTAVKQFIGPARAWLMEHNKAAKDYNQSVNDEISEIEEDLKASSRKKGSQADEHIRELKARIEEKKETKKSLYPVPFTDVLPEPIIKNMAETNGIATIATAEGNIINVLTGRSNYNQRGAAPNLDIFLAGYDGEPYHGIRVSSGEVQMPRVDISILLAIQPTLLEALCRSTDANGRGLVQRFLIFAPRKPEISIDHTRPVNVDEQHARRWNEHIRTIAARFMRPDETPETLELFNDADSIIRECWNDADQMIEERGPADEEGITGWLSKLHGKALRLAALFAILDEPQAKNITKEHAETAVAILKEYFIPHYVGSYESADNLSREHKAVISWIISNAKRTGNRDHFAERDLQQYIRQIAPFNGLEANRRSERLRDTLDDLQDLNIIRPLAIEEKPNRGRPPRTWQINPELFTK